MLTEKIKKIAEKIGLDYPNVSIKDMNEDKTIEYWEAYSKDGFFAYLVCFCDNGKTFNLEDYDKAYDTAFYGNDFINPFIEIMVFDNLEEETKQYDDAYNKIRKAAERKKLRNIFRRKYSVYIDEDDIEFFADEDGVNYLEYKVDDLDLRGYIYNISYYDLRKLFTLQGERAFRKNIRIGIEKDVTIRSKMQQGFREYIINGFIDEIEKSNALNDAEKIRDVLKEAGFKRTEKNQPNLFWFNHNGVTIYVEKEGNASFNRENASINFKSDNSHIINGAQTMSNMYMLTHDIKKAICNMFEKNAIKDEGLIDSTFNKIYRKIMIKTILLEGDSKYISAITEGLNTQIPVTDLDIIASETLVEDINKKLAKNGIRIIRAGEYGDKNNISVLDFAKYYLIAEHKPGTSKNLNKNNVEKTLKSATSDKDLASKMRMIIDAADWWSKNIDELSRGKEDNPIVRFGKNYFCSYMSDKYEDVYDDDMFRFYFDLFELDLESLKGIEEEYEVNDFKTDELFIKMKNRECEDANQIDRLSASEIVEVEKLLTSTYEKGQDLKNGLSKILKSKNYVSKDFRIVVRNMNEKEICTVNDDFFFSMKSFTTIGDAISKQRKRDYRFSLFSKEVEKTFVMWVITILDRSNILVNAIDDFSFADYRDEAAQIYAETLKAFEEGEEDLLPGETANNVFYVKIRAYDADDTFEFSNGLQIPRRTFCLKADAVERILERKLNMKTTE